MSWDCDASILLDLTQTYSALDEDEETEIRNQWDSLISRYQADWKAIITQTSFVGGEGLDNDGNNLDDIERVEHQIPHADYFNDEGLWDQEENFEEGDLAEHDVEEEEEEGEALDDELDGWYVDE